MLSFYTVGSPSSNAIEAEIRLATEAYRAGNLAEAETRVNRLLVSNPDRADVQLSKAVIQIAKGDRLGGLDSLMASLRLAQNGDRKSVV